MDINLLILLSLSFTITGLVAMYRQHWTEFCVCLFIAAFSTMGIFMNVL